MNPSRILLTTDFSPLSDLALTPAASLARRFEATLILANVLDGQRPSRPDPKAPHFKAAQAFYEADVERETQALKQLEARLRPLEGLEWRAVVGRGNPVAAILEVAKTEKAELIVISSQGRTGLRRMILGSVAEELARRSPLPVLIWKQPTEG